MLDIKCIGIFFFMAIFRLNAFCQQPSTGLRYDIPTGYSQLDTASGDFNRDGVRDYILILRNKTELHNPDTTRPLLILMGRKNDSLQLLSRNDHVVLCAGCGGVFGDPYQGITVKDSYFSVDHYGGSSWRWTRHITFRFNAKKNMFFLHKDGGESFHATDPDKSTSYFRNKNQYGKWTFAAYIN